MVIMAQMLVCLLKAYTIAPPTAQGHLRAFTKHAAQRNGAKHAHSHGSHAFTLTLTSTQLQPQS